MNHHYQQQQQEAQQQQEEYHQHHHHYWSSIIPNQYCYNNNDELTKTTTTTTTIEIKATLGDTKRRFLLPLNKGEGDDCYTSLVQLCQRLFSSETTLAEGKDTPSTTKESILHFEYLDEDNDRITVSSSHELMLAYSNRVQSYSTHPGAAIVLHLFVILKQEQQQSRRRHRNHSHHKRKQQLQQQSLPSPKNQFNEGQPIIFKRETEEQSSIANVDGNNEDDELELSSSTDSSSSTSTLDNRKHKRRKKRTNKTHSSNCGNNNDDSTTTRLDDEETEEDDEEEEEELTYDHQMRDSIPLEHINRLPHNITDIYVNGDDMIRVVRPLRRIAFKRGDIDEAKRRLIAMSSAFERKLRQQLGNEDNLLHIHIIFQSDAVHGELESAVDQLIAIAKEHKNVSSVDSCLFVCGYGPEFLQLKERLLCKTAKPKSLVRFLYNACRTDNCSSNANEWLEEYHRRR